MRVRTGGESTVVSLMRKNPLVVQCKVRKESTAASLRHILISPGVGRRVKRPEAGIVSPDVSEPEDTRG